MKKARSTVRTQKPFAYGSLLEALSPGLYPDKRHVIREFVQNSFDAIDALERADSKFIGNGLIQITIMGDSIVIADNGTGMNRTGIENYRYLGYSNKEKDKSVGFRGIGKHSGHSVAEKMIVSTSVKGEPKKYVLRIDAAGMLGEVFAKRNPPLDEVLEKFSVVTEEEEDIDEHYTVVELNKIRKDSRGILDESKLKEYLEANCPLPFNKEFKFAQIISEKLKANVPDYKTVKLQLNANLLSKSFPLGCTDPEFDYVLQGEDEDSPCIAYCWYCGNTQKGQFNQNENPGLVFRVKNFAIGDGNLTRQELWKTTPGRAFYFIGEIHVIDKGLIPSTDRSTFEANDQRENFYNRCRRISSILNKRAGEESGQRNMEEKASIAEEMIRDLESQRTNQVNVYLRDNIAFETRKSVEDLEKREKKIGRRRRKGEKETIILTKVRKIIKKGKHLLTEIESGSIFYDPVSLLNLDTKERRLYQTIIKCIAAELRDSPERLKSIITRIDKALKVRS